LSREPTYVPLSTDCPGPNHPENGQVSVYLLPPHTAYFPEAASGVASDKEGIDIVQLPAKAIVSQKTYPKSSMAFVSP